MRTRVLSLVLMGTIMAVVIVAAVTLNAEPASTGFCTAEGLITNDGIHWARDHKNDCKWTDPDGNVRPGQ